MSKPGSWKRCGRWLGVLLGLALLAGCTDAPVQQVPVAGSPAVVAGAPGAAGTGAGATGAGSAAVSGTGAANGGCLAQAPKPSKDARRVTVARAVDGDTIALADKTKVRLIGVNTPESVDPNRPVQPYGKEASAYTKKLLVGKEILLEPGQTSHDRYGRLLAWLWLPDGTFVNGLLVQQGYAQVYTFPDNPDHAELLLACQREAREANRGLWALPAYHDGGQAAKMDRSSGKSSGK